MMPLRFQYFLFIGLLHAVAVLLSFYVLEDRPWLFIASEVVVVLSLYVSYRLYQALVRPIEAIATGVHAITDQDFHVKFQQVGQKNLDQLIGVYNQMIDQLREERTQQARQFHFLDKLIRTSPTGIVTLDLDNNLSSCNPRAEDLLGIELKEGKGKPLDQSHSPLLKAIAEVPMNATQTLQTDGIRTYKIHKASFIDRGFSNAFVMIEELTEEKHQIEKQAYGKVIRMMAHEVNNSIGPINSILGSLESYQPHLPRDEQENYLEVLKIAQDRNQKLNHFMRNFADVVRLPQPQLNPVEVLPMLEKLVQLMSHQTEGKRIHFRIHAPEAAVVVPMDIRQMEQVLINVLRNAMDAIETEGNITLQLSDSPFDLKIIDDGSGISASAQEQVFSPFFSTKPHGQGVGLTLSREILLNHGWEFSLSTEKPGRTVFSIFQPSF
ncbi:MAG: ATP-binding protein [Bacteroidota bacterium]